MIFGIYIDIIVYLLSFVHFLLDGLNHSGIPFLSKHQVSLNKLPYDDFREFNFPDCGKYDEFHSHNGIFINQLKKI